VRQAIHIVYVIVFAFGVLRLFVMTGPAGEIGGSRMVGAGESAVADAIASARVSAPDLLLIAGASAVEVGTVNFWDPTAPMRIARELEQFLEQEGIEHVSNLVGTLKL